MYRGLVSITIMITLLLGCKKTDRPVEKSDLPASTTMDVSYGSQGAQKMDVYLPAGRTTANTPFMVLVHGGGWMSGDKGEFNAIITRLQTLLPDYAFFNINYRLFDGTNNRYPVQEDDVRDAVNFICNNAGEYRISNKMVLMGASAGAHLGLLEGYKHNSPHKAKAVISFFGPTDLVEFYNNPPSPALPASLTALFGFTPEQNLPAYQQASPAFFVNSQSVATLLLHGNIDQLVPVSQSLLLKNKLDSKGATSKLVIYPNEGHGWMGAALEDSYSQIQAFLTEHVK
jgi:acetyl esterase/lipase